MGDIETSLMEKIGDRYKYLIAGNFAGKMDIVEFYCDDISVKVLGDVNQVLEFAVTIKVDNLSGSGSGEVGDWSKILRDTDTQIRDFFYDFGFDPIEHKITRNANFNYVVNNGFFHEINFKWDEQHLMDISYQILYTEE